MQILRLPASNPDSCPFFQPSRILNPPTTWSGSHLKSVHHPLMLTKSKYDFVLLFLLLTHAACKHMQCFEKSSNERHHKSCMKCAFHLKDKVLMKTFMSELLDEILLRAL